ncbi:MAG TPA: CheR family methyltransferase [Myxococcales bacterium]|jgi:chemotaxis protein methyltransferase CheR
MPSQAGREEAAGQATLREFAAAVRARLGLTLKRDEALLSRRLGSTLERAGWKRPADEFVRRLWLARESSPLLAAAADALTVKQTSFFRDGAQLRKVARELAPALARRRGLQEPLRVLCAGCATGEEAYSLAMTLFDELPGLEGRPFAVVGVDVSPAAVAAAQAGAYPLSSLRRAGDGVPDWPERHFRLDGERLLARAGLRSCVRFERANLVAASTLEGLGLFDLVVCRNVLIYFDAESIERASAALQGLLAPGGALVLGHAEAGGALPLQSSRRTSNELVWFAERGAP